MSATHLTSGPLRALRPSPRTQSRRPSACAAKPPGFTAAAAVLALPAVAGKFGVRGGGRAYEARLRTESVIAVEQAALRSRATRG